MVGVTTEVFRLQVVEAVAPRFRLSEHYRYAHVQSAGLETVGIAAPHTRIQDAQQWVRRLEWPE